ncbi:MAG: class I SAM-dependent methyltransferase [Spartobacteria bacterium]
MKVAEQIRSIYERCPYPTVKSRAPLRLHWRLPPWEWITTVWESSRAYPVKILVAGCGTGNEAFAFAGKFPAAQIVAIDYSPRSIAVAKKLQRRSTRFARIRFRVGDLADRSFARRFEERFDFISCHGVLSYIPQTSRVFASLAKCLAVDGALYVGVNGSAHFSERWRKALTQFDTATPAHLDRIVALMDALSGEAIGAVVEKEPAYLAGDLFAPLIRNLPLTEWIRRARGVRLNFRSSYASVAALRSVFNESREHLLFPRSRAEVARLTETLRPAAFHQLIFTKKSAPAIPWHGHALLDWRPVLPPHLKKTRWPQPRGRSPTLRRVKIKRPEMNTQIELRLPEWGLEILRGGDKKHSVRELLGRTPPHVPLTRLLQTLYLLHQLCLLNLAPPRRRTRAAQ